MDSLPTIFDPHKQFLTEKLKQLLQRFQDNYEYMELLRPLSIDLGVGVRNDRKEKPEGNGSDKSNDEIPFTDELDARDSHTNMRLGMDKEVYKLQEEKKFKKFEKEKKFEKTRRLKRMVITP